MKTVNELKQKFKEMNELRPADIRRDPDLRLNIIRGIMEDLEAIERKALEWGAVSVEEINAMREFLPEVEASLHRLEAGARIREARSDG